MKIIAVFALLFTQTALAQNHHGQVSVGGMIAPVFAEPWSTVPAKNAVGTGAHLGTFLRFNYDDPNAGIELSANAIELLKSPMGMQVLTLNFFRRYFVEKKFQPIWSIGLGFSHNHDFFTAGTVDTSAIKLRAGVEMAWKKNIDLGFYLDHFTIFKTRPAEPTLQLLAPSLVFIYSFGEVKLPTSSVPAPVLASDAPANTTKVAKVDSDGDGVYDELDRCPSTEKGDSVNDLGCAKDQNFSINLNVKFKPGTATLEAGEFADIKVLADILTKHDDLKIELQGYTDNRGDEEKNTNLSQARADQVKRTLVKEFKIKSSRISTKGFGSNSPIASNKTAEGRAKNRRVTAVMVR